MPSDFDEFTERASPDYKEASELQTKNRDLLRKMMEAEDFTVNRNECDQSFFQRFPVERDGAIYRPTVGRSPTTTDESGGNEEE